MKLRTFITAAGLALLLSACLPDLPPSTGTVTVTIEPETARSASFDWQISGEDVAGNLLELNGTCGSDCTTIEVELRTGDSWELRVSPPPANPNTEQMGWVATGTAEDEVTADYVEVFSVARDAEIELTASFRFINVLLWDVDHPVNGPGTVTLTDLRTRAGAADFTVSSLQASCTTQAAPEPMHFGLPEGTELTITGEPQDIELVYLDDSGLTPIFGSSTACTVSGADSDNRPLGVREQPLTQPASN